MANVNKVILIGNVTREIEVKRTTKGTAVASTSLAINRSFRDESGQKHEETTFVDVELWGRLAEVAGEYAGKGSPLYVEGRLKQDVWEEKESGKKRQRLKVVVESLQLLGRRNKTEREERGDSPEPVARPAAAEEGDDIPF